MKKKIKWMRIIHIIGVILLIVGAVDPLEGSIVIATGILLIIFSAYMTSDRHRKLFLGSGIMIVVGVFFLFYFSFLGGIGGETGLSWWWGLFILPYPAGWLFAVSILIFRLIQKRKLHGSLEKGM